MSGSRIAVGASLFADEPDARWSLPHRLREISGLALTPDGRVMGHDDEVGVISEIDIATGQVVKRFSLGDPVVRGDFEGLAIDPGGLFYLVASNGVLHTFREGADRSYVDYETFDCGLGGLAEVEGAAYQIADNELILACKVNYSPAMQNALALYAWSLRDPDYRARPWLTVPVYPLARAVGAPFFHPSSVEIDPASGRLIVLAGKESAMVELDPRGEVLAARALGPNHPHPEGSTILPDGALVIADEGGDARAHVTRYARLHG